MPWTAQDAAQHNKSLQGHQHAAWAKIANAARAQYLQRHPKADPQDADAAAIRIANAMARRVQPAKHAAAEPPPPDALTVAEYAETLVALSDADVRALDGGAEDADDPAAYAELTPKARNALPLSAFAWVDADGVGHLPIRNPDGSLSLSHVRNALARLNQVRGMAPRARDQVRAKLQRILTHAQGAKAAANPDPADVHTPGDSVVGSLVTYLQTLHQRVRDHLRRHGRMTESEYQDHMQSARGHAGGTARRRPLDPADAGAMMDARQAFDPWMPPDADAEAAGYNPVVAVPAPEPPRLLQFPKQGAPIHYRKATDPEARCGECVFYRQGACALVEGAIDENAVCDLFLSEDAEPGEPQGASEPAPDVDLADLCARHAADDTVACHLFVAAAPTLQAAEPPEWVPVLPKPGRYAHPQYGTIAITPARNARFVANAQARVYGQDVPIDAEHQGKLGGCFGTLREFRVNADGSVSARAAWNARGAQALREARFSYVSPEWYDHWTDPLTEQAHEDVLIGLALTNRPFFKEGALPPLVASEDGLYSPDATAPPAGARAASPVPPAAGPAAEGGPGMGETVPTPQPVQLTEAEVQRFRELESALAAAHQAAEAVEAERRQMAERVAALEDEQRTARFSEWIAGRGGAADGAPWGGDQATHLALLRTLAAQFGEDGEPVQQYVALQRTQAAQLAEADRVLLAQRGRPGTGLSAGVAQQVAAETERRLAAEPTLSREQAEARVWAERPDLYEQADAERTATLRRDGR